jgi:tetratricopeptide (TPR) repeat protein
VSTSRKEFGEAEKAFRQEGDEGSWAILRSRAQRIRLLTNPTWQDFLSFVLSLGAVILISVILVLLGWDTLRQTITIDPISVPKSFSEDKGISPDVASRRLQDAIDKVLAHINLPSATPQRSLSPSSTRNRDADLFAIPGQRANILQGSDLPTIVLPAVGASLDSFAITIQNFLGLGRRMQISGEFTLFEGHLGLVLRKNHHVIFSHASDGDPNHPELLLEQAAVAVIDETEPIMGAMIHNNFGNDRHREGKSEEAASEYRVAVTLDPGNAVPHYNLANVLAEQGNPGDAIDEYRVAIADNSRDTSALVNLGNVLEKLGELESGTKHLEEAVAAFRTALKGDTHSRAPLDWAATQSNLGNALAAIGERESGTAHLEEAIEAYRAALQELTRDRVPLDWAQTQNNLGRVLSTLGERESGTARLEEAIGAYRAALQQRTRDRVPLDWAQTQTNLGNALVALGEREASRARLEEAVVAFRAALEERTRDRAPLDWARTQTNLGNVLVALGERESGTARLEEAVAAYRAALEELTRDRVPLDWAQTQADLGNALLALGERESGTARLEAAVAAYRAALEELTRDRVPLDWAQTQADLGNALAALGERESGTARLEEAVAALDACLTITSPVWPPELLKSIRSQRENVQKRILERKALQKS